MADDRTSFFLVAMVLLLGVASIITFMKEGTISGAATVSCDFIWPQVVVVDGTRYQCPTGTPYCYNTGAAQGISKCCKWSEQSGYQDCVQVGPAGEPSGSGTPGQCSETDAGRDYTKKGTTTGTNYNNPAQALSLTDFCVDGKTLREYRCSGREGDRREIYVVEEDYVCPTTCSDGKCGAVCSENDNGNDQVVLGSTTGPPASNPSQGIASGTDRCESDGKLTEFYCENGMLKSATYGCAPGRYCKTVIERGMNGGKCVAQACTPGTKKCEGTALKTCKPDGSGWSSQTCANGCDAAKNECKSSQPLCQASDADSAHPDGKNSGLYGTISYPGHDPNDVEECVLITPSGDSPDVTQCEKGSNCMVYELFCDADKVQHQFMTCVYGCSGGACRTATNPLLGPCDDTDIDEAHPTGKNYEKKGQIRLNGNGDESDYCIYNSQTVSSTPVGEGWLKEFYCEGGAKKNTVIQVPSGRTCTNGKLV